MQYKSSVFMLIVSLGIGTAYATTTAGQYLIKQIGQGGAETLRDASKSIYHAGERDRTVLDALAGALLQQYPSASDNTHIDALAWACKALAVGGDKRYYSAIREVAGSENANSKLRKYCDQAAATLGHAEGEQYAKGMAEVAESPAVIASSNKKNATVSRPVTKSSAQSNNPPPGNSRVEAITNVTHGMSLQQVYAMCGQPTGTTSYQTGKGFNPFNFKGGDVMRTAALYQGQGRVVFGNTNRFSSEMRVVEVLVNANESGYP